MIGANDPALVSNVLPPRPEKSSMLRQLKLNLSLGVFLVVVAVAVGPNYRLVAQEAPHQTTPSSEHAKGGHEAESGSANPMAPQPTLAIFTLVVFVVLFLVLSKFAWKPLLEALHKREAHLEHVLLETERARNESEALMAEHRKVMGRAAEEVRGILEKARTEAQSSADLIVKQAQSEAEQARLRAQREIASARDQALAEIWQKTADMAVSVAGRVLSKQLNDDEHRRLLDAAIQELPATSTNGHGGNA
jgi:F-type H+-transporting ATPase subunit b